MPKCVENWGPLWAHSCFPFESVNGDLLKLFHGTRNSVEQVCFSYMYKTNISNTSNHVTSEYMLRFEFIFALKLLL